MHKKRHSSALIHQIMSKMDIRIICIMLLSSFSFAFADGPCSTSKNTAELNACISGQVETAEKELEKYLQESRRRYADEPKTIEALDRAQKSWLQFRKDHCDAIYALWSGGTIRGAMHGNCMLEQTRRRIHDIWEAYLTFMDSTPPLLPEPVLK